MLDAFIDQVLGQITQSPTPLKQRQLLKSNSAIF